MRKKAVRGIKRQTRILEEDEWSGVKRGDDRREDRMKMGMMRGLKMEKRGEWE